MESLEELARIREMARKAIAIREGKPSAAERAHIMVCGGQGCISSKCKDVAAAIMEELAGNGIADQVRVVLTGCMGPCDMGPVAVVYPGNVFYRRLKPKDAADIVAQHIIGGKPVDRLLYRLPGKPPAATLQDIDLFQKQERVVLRNVLFIDPLSIDDAIARDGYAALAKALGGMSRQEVIEEVTKSGLRGRGGAGFPTGRKWAFASSQKDPQKYVVCNGDEGDPGAFMDRSVLEGDPHSVLEGMAICGYAIGANQGFVYVRAEYPLAIEHLDHAIKEARARGLLGRNLFGTDFCFDIEIRIGAGAFVCGEETALLNSLAGRRGEPRPRPPFPAVEGAFGKPTVINNVETLASLNPIILRGGDWYASIGTEDSKGTKVFALAGKITNTGIVEVPMGTTIRQIVYDIGGGIPRGKAFKAVQTGGPSGGCIPAQYLDTPIDYGSLSALGAIMGSGGMIVMDEDTCMVDLAKFFLDFCVDESCGKCAPCRIGVKRMHEILERITTGHGEPGDLDLLKELAGTIKSTALCGLGQTAPNPVLSTLKYFEEEYREHIEEHRCRANVCEFDEEETPAERREPATVSQPQS